MNITNSGVATVNVHCESVFFNTPFSNASNVCVFVIGPRKLRNKFSSELSIFKDIEKIQFGSQACNSFLYWPKTIIYKLLQICGEINTFKYFKLKA